MDTDMIDPGLPGKLDPCLEQKLPMAAKFLSDGHFGVGIYSSPDFSLLKANSLYLRLVPYPSDPSVPSLLYEKFREVSRTGETFYSKEMPGFGPDNGESYYNCTIMPITEGGSIKYIITMFEDVTDIVRARQNNQKDSETVQKQRKQLKAILENVSDICLFVNRKGEYLFANNGMRYGDSTPGNRTSMEDMYEKNKYFDLEGNVIPFQDTPLVRALKGEVVRNFRMAIRTPSKEVIHDINATPVCDDQGNIDMAVSCGHNVTSLIKQENLIKTQNGQLEAIIENISDILLIIDTQGRVIKTNKALKRYLGSVGIFGDYKDAEAALNEEVKYFDEEGRELGPEYSLKTKIWKGERIENEKLIIMFRGQKFYLYFNSVPVYDNNGNMEFTIITCHDITAKEGYDKLLKIHQEQLLNAEREKNETLEKAILMKDEFLSLLSHEFKTPITVINSAIQAIEFLYRDEISDKLRGYIQKIKQNSYRQLRLVNNLLDITRINAGHIKMHKRNLDLVFFTKAIVESVNIYAAQKGICLEFKSAYAGKIIGIDDEKYERILLNLLSNAIKFTSRGKKVSIRLGTRKGLILVEVKDQGLGIPSDKLDYIFERFGQVDSSLSRQSEGSGMGLSLVKLMVESLGGSISVKSLLGEGSTFSVLLPADRAMECENDTDLPEITDNRLIHATAIEFSDIYLT